MTDAPVAAIDMGTNSTRLLVHDGENTIERLMTITRLGQDVDRTGRLADEAIERVLSCLRTYKSVMDQHGVTRVAAKGLPLDPNVHQAMMEIPSDDAEPGTVIQEMQAGYLIKDRLLRPALVGVAKRPD